MREIKFRSWVENDRIKGSIYPFMNYRVEFMGGAINDIFATSGQAPLNPLGNKITYMQYTGLKDKNGREIYEGDILKCKCWDRKNNPDGFNPADETPYFYRNSLIEWWQSHSNLGYRLRDGKGKTLMIKPSSLSSMDVEIIGNVYENPELLEVAK